MELSLDLSLVYVPRTIADFLREVSKVKDAAQKQLKLDDYIKRLEDEMRKIDAFKRELPLCMLLLNDAILRLKEEAMQCKEFTDPAPVEEKFMPLKGNSDEDGEANTVSDACDNKKNWMSSVQLWSPTAQDAKAEQKQRSEEEDDRSTCENPIQLSNYGNRGGAFLPFKSFAGYGGSSSSSHRKEEKEVVSQVTGLSLMPPTISELGPCCSFLSTGNGSNQAKIQNKQQQNQQACRKQRRCWSAELHRLFIDALEQLGGPHVATPKQIREHMQVDGLTNDEVKSHLQKYRLHIRKLSTSSSPQGTRAKDVSSTGVDDMEAEAGGESEGHSWNGRQVHSPGEVD